LATRRRTRKRAALAGRTMGAHAALRGHATARRYGGPFAGWCPDGGGHLRRDAGVPLAGRTPPRPCGRGACPYAHPGPDGRRGTIPAANPRSRSIWSSHVPHLETPTRPGVDRRPRRYPEPRPRHRRGSRTRPPALPPYRAAGRARRPPRRRGGRLAIDESLASTEAGPTAGTESDTVIPVEIPELLTADVVQSESTVESTGNRPRPRWSGCTCVSPTRSTSSKRACSPRTWSAPRRVRPPPTRSSSTSSSSSRTSTSTPARPIDVDLPVDLDIPEVANAHVHVTARQIEQTSATAPARPRCRCSSP
jgi:hypothetical protein